MLNNGRATIVVVGPVYIEQKTYFQRDLLLANLLISVEAKGGSVPTWVLYFVEFLSVSEKNKTQGTSTGNPWLSNPFKYHASYHISYIMYHIMYHVSYHIKKTMTYHISCIIPCIMYHISCIISD